MGNIVEQQVMHNPIFKRRSKYLSLNRVERYKTCTRRRLVSACAQFLVKLQKVVL